MGSRGIDIGLVIVLVAMLCGEATAQSGCTNALTSLSPCLNYVTGNSSTPSSSCCSQLTNIVQSSPQCLCSVLNGGGAPLGITINQTLALSLPGACQVQTPPVNQCKAAANGPASSPTGSPADSSDDTPDPTITPSSSVDPSGSRGSNTVPTEGTSDGSLTRLPLHFVLFLLFITSCVSTIATF